MQEYKSKCCNSTVKISSGEEGTNFNMCNSCNKACDVSIPEPIRALSWKQPYASLMLHGKVETRTWSTSYRGLVLICASLKRYDQEVFYSISGQEQYDRIHKTIDVYDTTADMAIAVGRLVGCRLMKKEDENLTFVEYRDPWQIERVSKKTGKTKIITQRLWCHFYKDVKPIEPFDWKGTQGWKTLSPEEIKQIQIIT